jgi:hypothetical protein
MLCLMPVNSEIVMQKARLIVQQKQKKKNQHRRHSQGISYQLCPSSEIIWQAYL